MTLRTHPFYRDHRVLFQPCSRKLLLLNPTAGQIWEARQAGDTVHCIADKLAAQSGVAPSRLRVDVEQCIASWREQGLLNTETTAPPATQTAQPPAERLHPPANWPFRLTIQLCARSIQLRMTDRALHAALLPILAHLRIPSAASREHNLDMWRSPQGRTLIAIDGEFVETVRSPDAVIARVLYSLVELAYRREDDLAILHASAVAVKDGALILAGAGGSGKTTLAAQLQAGGFTYLSDDICPLTRRRQLRPVAMSQAVKAGSWPILRSLRPETQGAPVYPRLSQQVRFLPPISGNLHDWNRTWPLKGLLFPHYRPESPGAWRSLDPLESLQMLLQTQSIYSDHVAELLRLIEQTPAFTLHYATFEQADCSIRQIVSRMSA